jgi:hypothetical protein
MHWAKARESEDCVPPALAMAAVVDVVPSLATLGELGPPQAASAMAAAMTNTAFVQDRWYFNELLRLEAVIEATPIENSSRFVILPFHSQSIDFAHLKPGTIFWQTPWARWTIELLGSMCVGFKLITC